MAFLKVPNKAFVIAANVAGRFLAPTLRYSPKMPCTLHSV